jgi:hypothetical protein
MRSIYKYEITEQCMPLSAPITNFLSVQVQNDKICVWAEVDTEKKDRHFMMTIIGTGWELDKINNFDKSTYLGSVQYLNGKYMWHIYYLELKVPYEEIKALKMEK